ncbi:MAG TPA: DUF1491 family protein [Hyphomicrobiales bacterium]|nr:DUF1491 family protein [Hyphomicrobiales bacterium]
MRVTSAIWAAAFIRRCHSAAIYAVVRRRGAAEAGAIFVVLDRLDGTRTLFGPAPQAAMADEAEVSDRRFTMVGPEASEPEAVEAKLRREMDFDPDLWILEIEDRQGRHFLDLVA